MLVGFRNARFAKLYNKDHIWIDVNNKIGKVGISSYKAFHLGDINAISFPATLDIKKGDELCNIEATKINEAILSPIDLTVTKFNEQILENPQILSRSSESKGFLAQVTLNEEIPSDFMDRKEYLKFLDTLSNENN